MLSGNVFAEVQSAALAFDTGQRDIIRDCLEAVARTGAGIDDMPSFVNEFLSFCGWSIIRTADGRRHWQCPWIPHSAFPAAHMAAIAACQLEIGRSDVPHVAKWDGDEKAMVLPDEG